MYEVGLFCYDIKPLNFLYKVSGKIVITDTDGTYCLRNLWNTNVQTTYSLNKLTFFGNLLRTKLSPHDLYLLSSELLDLVDFKLLQFLFSDLSFDEKLESILGPQFTYILGFIFGNHLPYIPKNLVLESSDLDTFLKEMFLRMRFNKKSNKKSNKKQRKNKKRRTNKKKEDQIKEIRRIYCNL